MNSELDRTHDPYSHNEEFEEWLDEINRPTPEMIAAETEYWNREQMKMEESLGKF